MMIKINFNPVKIKIIISLINLECEERLDNRYMGLQHKIYFLYNSYFINILRIFKTQVGKLKVSYMQDSTRDKEGRLAGKQVTIYLRGRVMDGRAVMDRPVFDRGQFHRGFARGNVGLVSGRCSCCRGHYEDG